MSGPGEFNALAREFITGASDGRCVGCGRTNTNTQHRRARGMGGTSHGAIGHPSNGLLLCGSGTTGCHGWTEAHPTYALALGWRLSTDQPAYGTPYWDRVWGWRAWVDAGDPVGDDTDEWPALAWVDPDDLDDPDTRAAAVQEYQRWRDARRRAA